jgi:hypothetical protein
VQEQGLDDVDMMKEADEEDIKDCLEKVCDTTFHRTRIMKEYRKLKNACNATANSHAQGGSIAAATATGTAA